MRSGDFACHILPDWEIFFVQYLRHMSKLFMAKRFLQHQWQARTRHEVHSPFVFALSEEVLNDTRNYYAFDEIESRRKRLLQNHTTIRVDDHGAGSHSLRTRERRISDIAASSLTSPRFGQLLFRLAQFLQPRTILEMGTSLGISGAYLASGAPQARLITLEGSAAIAEVARTQFASLGLEQVTLLEGEFSQTLPTALHMLGTLDLVFIDGNHQFAPTLAYFDMLQPYLHDRSVVVFDDIHWSRGMDKAWGCIKEYPRVRLSVDLFYKGIVAFDTRFKQPVHLALRY